MNGLIAQLSALSGLAEGMIWQAALVFLRVGGFVAMLPALGEQALPTRVKLAAAVAITLIVAPGVGISAGAAPGPLALIAEAATGLALGFGLRLTVLGLQMAGTLAAQSLSLAQMFAGTGPEPAPIVANLLFLSGVALFLAMGGLARSVELLLLSYQMVPLGAAPDPAALASWSLGRVVRIFALSFALAAPFVLAALLYNLALGAINRAMPTLMVSFIGAPALTLGGLILLALAAPLVLEIWRAAMDRALAAPFSG